MPAKSKILHQTYSMKQRREGIISPEQNKGQKSKRIKHKTRKKNRTDRDPQSSLQTTTVESLEFVLVVIVAAQLFCVAQEVTARPPF